MANQSKAGVGVDFSPDIITSLLLLCDCRQVTTLFQL